MLAPNLLNYHSAHWCYCRPNCSHFKSFESFTSRSSLESRAADDTFKATKIFCQHYHYLPSIAYPTITKYNVEPDPNNPNIENGKHEVTIPGSIAMLLNGVEITNYKSDNKIYYGPLESFNVLNGGSGYVVMNPPLVSVSSAEK